MASLWGSGGFIWRRALTLGLFALAGTAFAANEEAIRLASGAEVVSQRYPAQGKQVPVNFFIVLDSEGQNLKAWSVFAFPTSYVVDKKGRMRLGLFGSIEWDSPETVAKLEALLAEPD